MGAEAGTVICGVMNSLCSSQPVNNQLMQSKHVCMHINATSLLFPDSVPMRPGRFCQGGEQNESSKRLKRRCRKQEEDECV